MIHLILVGGGGHCKACIDVIEQCAGFAIAGILDAPGQVGKEILGYPVIGTDELIPGLAADHQFLITVGQISSAATRVRIFEKIKQAKGKLALVIAPSAVVSKHAILGEGTIVMHHASVNAASRIGANCIINTGSNVEHDCTIGSHVHISTHAVVNGNCAVGIESFIGSNSVIVNGISIGNNVVVGAGTVVHTSMEVPGTYVGNPARKITAQ